MSQLNSKSNLNIATDSKEEMETDYYKVDDEDMDNLIFTKQAVKQIMLFEKTTEIIGIIGESEIRPNLMKFILQNKTGDKIQFLVWDSDIIGKIKSLIMPGNILHIDGAFAKHRNESLSGGNIEYDLNIMSNSKVRLLKESICFSPVKSNTPVQPVVQVSFEDCLKYSDTIQITGYIKNVISVTSMPNSKLNQGCLTDCQRYKLEIRMPVLCDMSEFSVGSHVKVTGTIKYSQHPYIWVVKKSDVEFQSDEKKTIKELIKGTHVLKRPLKDSSNVSSENKMFKCE